MYYQRNLSKKKFFISWYTLGLPGRLYIAVWLTAAIPFFFGIYDFSKLQGAEHSYTWMPMRMISSVCFIVSTLAVLSSRLPVPRSWRFRVPVFFAMIIGILSVLNFAMDLYLEINGHELFLSNIPGFRSILNPSIRMSLFTSFSFILITAIIFMLADRRYNAAHIINIPVGIISYFFLIAYVLHVKLELNLIPLSLDSSISLASLCLMIYLIAPQSSLMKVFVSGLGSVIARKLILPLIAIPIIVGWLRMTGERKGYFNSEIGVVLIILIYTTCFMILAWILARSFTSIDQSRRKADKLTARINQKLSLLSELSGRLLTSNNPQLIVNDLCVKIMEFLNCHVFFNYIINDSSGRLHLNAYAGISEDEARQISWLEPGSAICGCVARDAHPIIAEDIQHTDDPRANIVRKFGVNTYASFPLMSHKQVIGTLSFGAKDRNHFQEDELSLMKTVADQVAIAMGRINNERHLRESEERFRRIAESLPTPISITKYQDGTFMFVNDVYCQTLGFSQHELIGKKAIDIYHDPKDREKIMDLVRTNGSLEYYETRIKKSDGTSLWVMSSIRPIIFEGEPALLGSTVDIDQQKKQQEELFRLNRTLNALGKSSQLMMHSKNEYELLKDVCRIITEDCGYMMVWVGYVLDDPYKSVEPVAYYGLDRKYIEQMKITWADTDRGRGPTGIAIRTRKPAVCKNMLTDPAFAPWREEAIKRGFASSLVLPLLSEGKALGVLTIYSKEPDSFPDDDVRLLANLADDVAYGIIHIRLAESEKKAAAATKESEEKYRMLFDSMVEGFAIKEIIVDSHGKPFDWKLISANPGYEKHTGLKLSDIAGKTARQYLPKLEKSWTDNFGKAALDGGTVDFINHSDDLNAWFHITAFQIKKGTFACIIENISARVLAEKELRNTKDYLENLINYANAPIVVWDNNAAIRVFNRAFEHLTGYLSADVIGKPIDILFPEESKVKSHEKIRNTVTENLETIEIPILTKDGRIRTVLWNSANIVDPDNHSVMSTIAQGNDITERKIAEQELRKSKEQLDLALDSANIGIWTWYFKTNEWEWDGRISSMLGIGKASVKYSLYELEQYLYEEDISHVKRAFERSRDESTSLDTFFRLKHNGEFRFIEVKGSVTKDSDGNPFKMSGVCMDITALKATSENAMVNLNQDLLRSNKELEQFAYVASHDLQEPLRMVSSFTQLLAARYKNKLDSEAMEFIDFAVDGAQRMQRLINDLLEYSRIKTRGKILSSTDMNFVFNQTLHNLSIKISEKNAIVSSDQLPVVNADEGQMVQLLQNLIENGIKFTKEQPLIHVSCQEDHDFYIFSVKDNGIGIEPQYYERIFQIFQRLHLRDEYGGTGIGLAICQRIIERHGGKIWVASSNGSGTTFNFTLRKSYPTYGT